nr:uncharacterized protein LOC111506729 [Leptinotarsa decemlineata]
MPKKFYLTFILSVLKVKMSNSSEIVSDNLTFSNLNHLIDQWVMDVQENYKTFHLQAGEMNKLMFDTCNYHEQLKLLQRRLILAKCFQGQVDMNIELAHSTLNQIESNLVDLERDVLCCCRVASHDIYRKNTYEIAEQIDTMMNNFNQALEILDSKVYLVTDSSSGNSDMEGLTALLQYCYRQLENIEMKTYLLKDALAESYFHKQHVLRLLNLKEND